MVKIIANPKKVIKILQAQNKYFATSKLQVVKDKKISKDLLDYERSQKNQFKKIICHKIGMVYMKGEQTSEDDILGNRTYRSVTRVKHRPPILPISRW
jgi:hypothetical protein